MFAAQENIILQLPRQVMYARINEVKHRPEVHKDTGVSQSTHDKVASPPSPHCQHVLVNQSVISSSHLYGGTVADVTQRK